MKLAVIKFSALGDIAASLPIIRLLKYKPTIITTTIGYELLKDEFDDFIILKSKKILDLFKLIYEIRKRKFDLIIDLQCNDRSRFVSKLSGVKYLHNKKVNPKQQVSQILYEICNSSSKNIINEFEKSEKLLNNGEYIVLNCGSSPKWASKRPPYDKWKEISKVLYDKYQLPFYLTGDKSELEYIKELSKVLHGEKKILAGKTDIQELKKVLSNAFLTVSTDSAPMHISAAQDTPTIGIFGATNWIISAPYGEHSTVIYDKSYFKDNKPLIKNSQVVNNEFYNNIDIEEGIERLKQFL